jgi:hypothetical protein
MLRHRIGSAICLSASLSVIPVVAHAQQESPPIVDPSPAPTATTVPFDSTFYYAGYDITVEDVTYDPSIPTVAIDGLFHNTSKQDGFLIRLVSDGGASIYWDDLVIPLSVDGVDLPAPAGTTVRATLSTSSVPEGFALEDAELVFGRPGDHQARLPLAAGSEATWDAPMVLDPPGTARIRRIATFRITEAQVIPARCEGTVDAVGLLPAAASEASILLTLTESGLGGIGVGGVVFDAYVTEPSGIDAVSGLQQLVLDVREVFRDVQYCFTVATPAQGRYKVTFDSGDRKGSIVIDIPAEAP